MRQPAPIKGERMETLLVQAIVDNTPIREDAPSRPDHRTEQHITVNLPDSIRHSSDSSRYLINRDAPIGGQAVKMSDIEADNYDIKMVDAYILSALDDLERKYDESTVSRKSILQITKLLKSTILGVIEDREASLNKVETWAYVRELQMNGRSEAQAPGNGADEDNVDKNETTHQEIGKLTATTLTMPIY
ncbi:hypothetical protein EYC80_000859 [Monilinia laxa]|uniref:Uncharacterized protein n=1 Tax=Monilinia laxa TaxID=61186 RepID=A0A5N6K7A7_MONLA|nr:hypothetical protein EYC80_000859 [Monilinia laxa]